MKYKFKKGDIVRIKNGVSTVSKKYKGQVTVITDYVLTNGQPAYYIKLYQNLGVWEDELEIGTKLGKVLE